MDNKSKESLDFILNPGAASFEDILELMLSLNDLYVAMGASGLKVELSDLIEYQVPESLFELHVGTEFANIRTKIKESMFPRYVPRQQVYDAIDKHVKPETAIKIKKDIDRRFPEDKFDGLFPYCITFGIIFNKYLSCRTDRYLNL